MKRWRDLILENQSLTAIAYTVILASIWYAGYRYWCWNQTKIPVHPFLAFTTSWGGVIGIAATLLVGLITFLIPSRIDKKIGGIAERLQSPLENFEAVYQKALDLLLWVGTEKGSSFSISSATPVFGIELDDERRNKWTSLLKKRLVESTDANLMTYLQCLDPDSEKGAPGSPLWSFCKRLEEHNLLGDDIQTAADLYIRSMAALYDFASVGKPGCFKLRCGPKPILQFVLAEKSDGTRKAILYFPGVSTGTRLLVSGFVTEDQRWIDLIQNVEQAVLQESWDVLDAQKKDPRTTEQKKRCEALLRHQLLHREAYEREGLLEWPVIVHPDVFPPEVGIATKSAIQAIRKTGEALTKTISPLQYIGVDVGTGTGVLALALAAFLSKVYALDISSPAVENAKVNVAKAKDRLQGEVVVLKSDLLEALPFTSNSPLLVVFNYPFYPSPVAVYNPQAKQRAGIRIVRELFAQMQRFHERSIALIPYAPLAGEHSASHVADSFGYQSIPVVLGDDLTVHAFVRDSHLAHELRRLVQPAQAV